MGRFCVYSPDMRVFNIQRGAEPHGVLGGVVGEDDGPHRGLARAGFAHKQYLLLHDVSSPAHEQGTLRPLLRTVCCAFSPASSSLRVFLLASVAAGRAC